MHQEIVYVSLDARRCLGVYRALGCRIVLLHSCDYLSQIGPKEMVFCLESVDPRAASKIKTTFGLLQNESVKNFIDGRAHSQIVTFKPSPKIESLCARNGWGLICPPLNVSARWEDKIQFADIAKEMGVSVPRSEVVLLQRDRYEEVTNKFGIAFVVQSRRGQAGNSSFVVRDKAEWDSIPFSEGMRVKISQFVQGDRVTANVCLHSKGEFSITSLWIQLTGDSRFTPYELGTFGNCPYQTDDSSRQLIVDQAKLITDALHRERYIGVFGIDFIAGDGQVWVIEVNPRLVATVAFEAARQGKISSLAVHSRVSDVLPTAFDQSRYSLVVIRNCKPYPIILPTQSQSGIYRFVDGEWMRAADVPESLGQVDDQSVLFLSSLKSSRVAPGGDYAQMICGFPVLDSTGELRDSVIDFYERIILLRPIRVKDFWKGVFGRVLHLSDVLSKPVERRERLADAALARLRQTQVDESTMVKLLGEIGNDCLVELEDGCRGWIEQKCIERLDGVHSFVKASDELITADEFFRRWAGVPYLKGGNSSAGIDCSALVQRFYKEVFGRNLPKHSRDQRVMGIQVNGDAASDGDLVFAVSKLTKKPVYHVGILFGGKVWHACLKNQKVRHENLGDFEKAYCVEVIRRII